MDKSTSQARIPAASTRQAAALTRIVQERGRQDRKWGADRHQEPRTWLTVMVEEIGEVARADLEHESDERLAEEIVQVAAVAIAWLEDLSRPQRMEEP